MEAIEEEKGEKERGRGVVSYTIEGRPSPLKVDHHLIPHRVQVAHSPDTVRAQRARCCEPQVYQVCTPILIVANMRKQRLHTGPQRSAP